MKLSNVERKVWEPRRDASTKLRRKLRKGIATSATAATIPCSHCSRLFRAHIGLKHKVDQMVLIDYDGQIRRCRVYKKASTCPLYSSTFYWNLLYVVSVISI